MAEDEHTIETVDGALFRVPLPGPVGGGATRSSGVSRPLESWDLLVCSVRTRDGTVGTGFSYELRVGGEAVLACLQHDLAPLVRGSDCFATEGLWNRLYWSTYYAGRRGLLIHALSALDTALWDCKARVLDIPLARLLGAERRAVPAYDSSFGWLNRSIEELVRQSAEAVEGGFHAVKVFVGSPDIRHDAARVAAVRGAVGPDCLLMVDASQKWSFRTAVDAAKRLAEHDIHWIEEPVTADDPDMHVRLGQHIDTRVATGQCFMTRHEARPFIETRAVDVLQHDVGRIGGVTEWWRVAQMAEAAGIEVAPHFLAEVHVSLLAACPAGRWVEHTPWLSELLVDPPRPVEGQYLVPEGPGHGLELRSDLERLRVA